MKKTAYPKRKKRHPLWMRLTALFLSLSLFQADAEASHAHIPLFVEPDTTKAVGGIPYRTGTTPTGGVTCTVPVEAAPGRGGMQPRLRITYNSQGGNGFPSGTTGQISFPVTRLTDASGNYMDFTYEQADGQYYVTRIAYGAHTSSPAHPAEVVFTYVISEASPRFIRRICCATRRTRPSTTRCGTAYP